MLRCQQNPPDANYSYKMEIVLGWADPCLWCPWQFSLEYKWFGASYRYLILEVILSRTAWCHKVMRHFPRFLHGQWKCFSVKCPCLDSPMYSEYLEYFSCNQQWVEHSWKEFSSNAYHWIFYHNEQKQWVKKNYLKGTNDTICTP